MTTPSILTPRRSGVYRSPPDPAGFMAHAAGTGATGVPADLASVQSKAGLLATLARSLALPATFGANWDALSDSLKDLPVPPQGMVLHLVHAEGAQRALAREWLMFVEILRDAAIYWKERGKPFIVFVDDANELPPWL
jgi:hypothetical protein